MAKRIGLIGLGDMGIGMAANIIQAGFELTGFDLRSERLTMLEKLGGKTGSGLAKVKCPACEQKLGEKPAYRIKPAESANINTDADPEA